MSTKIITASKRNVNRQVDKTIILNVLLYLIKRYKAVLSFIKGRTPEVAMEVAPQVIELLKTLAGETRAKT